jgi:hypothetical protein
MWEGKENGSERDSQGRREDKTRQTVKNYSPLTSQVPSVTPSLDRR